MKQVQADAQTQATMTRAAKKEIAKQLPRRTKFFHGNKAYEQFRLLRNISERIKVWQEHNEPESFYEIQYQEMKLKGKYRDDWKIDYWAWSPTGGQTVAVEWLEDIKSSNTVKVKK